MSVFFTKRLNKKSPPGELIDVGGFKMHIHCTGQAKNGPPVIIEAGGGMPTPVYYWLQEKLSKHLQVCTYDRAGIGWSDDSGQPKDVMHMAEQLHTLLEKSGIAGPYVFIGHSIGGLILRIYAHRHPQNVAGLVLLDPSHPGHVKLLNMGPDYFDRYISLYKKIRLVARLGFAGIFNPLVGSKSALALNLPREAMRQLKTIYCNPGIYSTHIEELEQFAVSVRQVIEEGNALEQVPLIVISASDRSQYRDSEQKAQAMYKLHQQLASLSKKGQHIVMQGAGHASLCIKEEFADQVVGYVLQLIESLDVESTEKSLL